MNLLDLMDQIRDPRMLGKVQHNLSSIIFVTLCGILSGCETWNDIHDYCEFKLDWLKKYVDLDNGVPSAWTFRRVFTLLDPNTLELLLRAHASSIVSGGKPTDHIAVDGKALCGSSREGLKSLHSVSAWCHENGLVLAEKQVDEKSHEIAALPFLLKSLDLKGHTVSIDAAGCQKNIAHLIQEKKGQYVLGLKRNHPKLYEAVGSMIKEKGEKGGTKLYDSFDESHGRLLRRRYFGYALSDLPEINDWAGAKSVVAVETIRSRNNDPQRKVTAQWRYYLSSHQHDHPKLPDYIRHHWEIENKLHWVLDVHLKEDNDQKAERKSARSFALLKRIALNVIRAKKELLKNKSLRRKLKRAAWDNEFLISLLI